MARSFARQVKPSVPITGAQLSPVKAQIEKTIQIAEKGSS